MPPEETLRRREAWKYVELVRLLTVAGITAVFEYRLEQWVFDLAVPCARTLVEFDGGYHGKGQQAVSDDDKDECAARCGWRVIRIATADSAVIPASVLIPHMVDLAKVVESV